MYPWYLAGALLGFLGIITHKYPLYRTYIWISPRGTVRIFFLITQSVLHADRENQHINIDVERMEGIFMSLAVISSSIKSRNFLWCMIPIQKWQVLHRLAIWSSLGSGSVIGLQSLACWVLCLTIMHLKFSPTQRKQLGIWFVKLMWVDLWRFRKPHLKGMRPLELPRPQSESWKIPLRENGCDLADSDKARCSAFAYICFCNNSHSRFRDGQLAPRELVVNRNLPPVETSMFCALTLAEMPDSLSEKAVGQREFSSLGHVCLPEPSTSKRSDLTHKCLLSQPSWFSLLKMRCLHDP